MANGKESTKVTFEPSLDDDELTMDELAHFFKNYKIDMSYLIFKIKN